MSRALVIIALFATGSLLWAGQLALGSGPWPQDASNVTATFMVVLTAVSVIGTTIAGGRWARRLATVLALGWLALAPALEASPLWWTALVVTGAALAAIVGTGLAPIVRRLPAAAGPPGEAVTLPLLLLGAPVMIGLISTAGLGVLGWIGVITASIAAGMYSKAAPGALFAVRFAAPVVLGGLGLASLPWGVAIALWGGAVARLAWTQSARVAVRPLSGRGTAVPIPPELTPTEILDAAGVDDRGRRRGSP